MWLLWRKHSRQRLLNVKSTKEATGNESGGVGSHGGPFPGSNLEKKSCNI